MSVTKIVLKKESFDNNDDYSIAKYKDFRNRICPHENNISIVSCVKEYSINDISKVQHKILKQAGEKPSCCICLEEFNLLQDEEKKTHETIAFACGHMFHRRCIGILYIHVLLLYIYT